MKKQLQAIPPLIWRGIAFLGAFVLITGSIGPKIISGNILFSCGFGVYGGLGKALLFSALAFCLLIWRQKRPLHISVWRQRQLFWACVALLLLALAWINVDHLLVGDRSWFTIVLTHTELLGCVVSALFACISLSDARAIVRSYQKELFISIVLGAAFFVFLLVVYALWPFLAKFVLSGVMLLLSVTGPTATLVANHTLVFDKFGITIAEYCSGIESIALFTGLYVVVALLDWPAIRKKRYFLLFPFALFALCLCNMLRIYALILAGYYINPAIAFSLFHTYAGMIFFIVYSGIFWALAYKYLVKSHEAKHE